MASRRSGASGGGPRPDRRAVRLDRPHRQTAHRPRFSRQTTADLFRLQLLSGRVPTDLQQIGLAVDGLGSAGEKLVTKELERLQPRPSRTCWLGLRWRPSSGPRDILGCRKIKSTPRKGANLKGLITERLEIVVLPAWSIATAANRRDAGRTASGERRRRAALPYLTISPDTPKSYAIGS